MNTTPPGPVTGAQVPSGAPAAPRGMAARLVRINMAWCELLVLAMMLVVALDVLARALLGLTWQMSEEIGGYLLVTLVFCSLAVAALEGAMLRVDFLFLRLPRRAQDILDRLYALLGLVFVALWTWQLGRLVWSSYTREMVSNSAYPVPLWIPQLLMPVGAAALLAVLVGIVWGRVTVAAASGAEP